MNFAMLAAAFVVAVISNWDVDAIIAAAATNEAPPSSWMQISDRPKAGKFFQVRSQEGFRAITSIADKAEINWRWIEASEWNRNRYSDPGISDNLRPIGGITLTPRFAPFGSKTKPPTQRSGTRRSFPVLWLPRFAGDEPATTPAVELGEGSAKDRPPGNRLPRLCVKNRVAPGDRRTERFESVLRGDEVSIWIAAKGGCELRSKDHSDDMPVFRSIGGSTFRLTDLCRQLLGGVDCDLPTLPSMELLADALDPAFPEIVALSIKDKGRSAVGVVDHDGNEVYLHEAEWLSLPVFNERPTSGRLHMADGASRFAIAAARE